MFLSSASEPKPGDGWSSFEAPVLAALFVLWLVCFALAVYSCVRATPYPPIYIRTQADSEFPIVDGSRLGSSFKALRKHDVLLSWNGISLRNAGDIDLTLVVGAGKPNALARVELLRDGRAELAMVPTTSLRRYWPRVAAATVFSATALVFALRAALNALTRSIVYCMLAWAFLFSCTFETPDWLPEFGGEIQIVSATMVAVFGVRVAMLFPHGIEPGSRLLRFSPWLFAISGPLDVQRVQGSWLPRAVAHQLAFSLNLAAVCACVGLGVWNYRHVGAVERRQIKWLAWAVWVVASNLTLFALIALARPDLTHYYYGASTIVVLIPIALLLGIVRFNHFDIDRILSSTAVLWLSLIMSALVIATLGSMLGGLSSHTWGWPNWMTSAGTAGVVSVLTVSTARWLNPWLDSRLFVERNALQTGLSSLLNELARTTDRVQLVELLGAELLRLLKPHNIVIYARQNELALAPVFVRGTAIPPALAVPSRLVELCGERRVLTFERGRASNARELPGSDLAFIEALDARIVLAVRDHEQTAAAVFVGPKGSGDVFVASDLALLASISHVASERWVHAERAQSESLLRRYVPHALAERIARGVPLEEGEREVTVLFVDIRGYSTYAEKREPREVFGMVSAYTRAASELIVRRGGAVVDFSGDGMMAVFGAHGAGDKKEEAALRAAQDLVDAMRNELPVSIVSARAPIGVGIATGMAFVGSVRSADHAFWTALGAVTNRAARLQVLTRELDCDIIVDKATYNQTRSLNDDFSLNSHVLLKGHVQRVDVYTYSARKVRVPELGTAS